MSRFARPAWPRPAALLACLLPILIAALPGCSRDRRPSLILVILDTTRADHLGCYGYGEARTATLDSLATAGVRFDQAITAAPVTAPAITTILTGTLPAVHGMRDNERFAISPDLPLLAESFRAAGYRTGAVVAAVPLLGRNGYARGFESYDDHFAEDAYDTHDSYYFDRAADLRGSERRAAAVTDRALDWLAGLGRDEPYFLFVHYFDPHGPFDPPPEHARRHPTEPYDGEIAYMDAQLGRLLAGTRARAGKGAQVRVLVVGDHGEALFEHDEMAHGFFLYDSTLRVPLIVSGGDHGPAPRRGRVVPGQVRTLDVAPTICSWMGLPRPGTFAGEDLSPALAPGGAARPLPAACDTAWAETFLTQLRYGWSPLMAVRTAAWKWVKAPSPELYDLAADAGELRNLAGAEPVREAALGGWLDARLARADSLRGRLGARPVAADPDLERKLAALGYLSGARHASLAPDWSLPDPKDGNRTWNVETRRAQLIRMADLCLDGHRPAKALGWLDRAAAVAPLRGREPAMRGLALERLELPAEALDAYAETLLSETDPEFAARLRLEMTRLLLELGRRDEAAALVRDLRQDPGAPDDVRRALRWLAP